MLYIYVLKDPRNSKVKYVGKTNNIQHRLYRHIWQAKNTNHSDNRYKENWINLLLRLDLKPIIEIKEVVTKDNWAEREIYWIDYFGLKNLTNLQDGGSCPPSPLGRKHSEETKKKISSALKGKAKNYPGYWKGKIGKQHPSYGRKFRSSTRKILSDRMLGAKNPRYKIKESKKVKRNRVKSLCKKVVQVDINDNVIKIWDSIREVSEKFKLPSGSVGRVCNGKRNHTKGLRFKYACLESLSSCNRCPLRFSCDKLPILPPM